MNTYDLEFLVSSDPVTGATNISDDGSYFEVLLEQPFIIPNDAIMSYIKVNSATIWYNTYNIIPGVNDLIKVTYDDTINPPVNVTMTVDGGLYSVDALNDSVQRLLGENGFPRDLFSIIGDQSTQKTIIQFNYSGAQVDFTIALTFRDVLGFNSRLSPLAPSVDEDDYDTGDVVANFNTLEYYLLHSSLVSNGLRINNKYSQTIAQIQLTTAPNTQIAYAPLNPTKIINRSMIGRETQKMTFTLTNDKGERVNTRGESYSIRFTISYQMPYITVREG